MIVSYFHRNAARLQPLCAGVLLGAGLLTQPHPAHAQTVAAGYSYRVFATAPSGVSKPDSIVVANGSVWVGYGNGRPSNGTPFVDPNPNIVQYDLFGNVLHTYNIQGNNDGLKIDPATGLVWALQNQDGNPMLSLINPVTQTVTPLTYAATTPGRGFDDVTFLGGKTYLSISNPGANSDPVIVSATISGGVVTTTAVLAAGAVPNAVTDSDSLTQDLNGHLVLDDQGGQLVFVGNPGTALQTATPLALSDANGAASVDDTLFVNDPNSELLVTATGNNTIYAISGPFATGNAFSSDTSGGFVGLLNQQTGFLTPVFTAPGSSVHGLALLSVPEPSASAMLLAGAGSGAGMFLRRRARRRRSA